MVNRHDPRMDGIMDWFKKKKEAQTETAAAEAAAVAMMRELPRFDYYEALGVPPDAPVEQIRANYRDLAIKFHPDRNPGDPVAEEKFKQITQAFSALNDPSMRARYDRLRAAAAGPRPPQGGPLGRVPAPQEAPAAAVGPSKPPEFRRRQAAAAAAGGASMWEIMFGPTVKEPEPSGAWMDIFGGVGAPGRSAAGETPRVTLPPERDFMENFEKAWPLGEIFSLVQSERRSPGFAQARAMAVHPVAGFRREPVETELAAMLGVSPAWAAEQIRTSQGAEFLWREVLVPLSDRLAAAFEEAKPADIPGHFSLSRDSAGRVELVYSE